MLQRIAHNHVVIGWALCKGLLEHQFAGGEEVKEHACNAPAHQANGWIFIHKGYQADHQCIGATVEYEPDDTDHGEFAPLLGHSFVLDFAKGEEAVAQPREGHGKWKGKETSWHPVQAQRVNPDI